MLYDSVKATVRNLAGKALYLCGNPAVTGAFCAKYRSRLTIAGILDTPCRDDGEPWAGFYASFYQNRAEEIPDLPHVSMDQLSAEETDWCIVICQEGIYGNEICRYLDFYGCAHLRQYTFSCIFDCVLDGRKVILMHGFYCFVRDLYMLMTNREAFSREYLLFAGVYEEDAGTVFRQGINTLAQLCDVYIYNQESRPLYFDPSLLPSGCRRICIPCVNFGALMPQLRRVNLSYSNPLFSPVSRVSLSYKTADWELNRMLEEGISEDEAVRRVTSDDYFDPDAVRNRFRRELRMLTLYEKHCDVRLEPYIRTHYRTERLFNNCEHWHLNLAMECMRQILLLLGIEDLRPSRPDAVKQYTQMPIYPSVAKALDLQWVTPGTTYYLRWGSGTQDTTFEEYVRRYLRVVGITKQLMEIW